MESMGRGIILSLLDFFKNKKVLITGHTGFKGSWLTKILTMAGAKVVGIALDPPTEPNLFNILKLEKNIKHNIMDIGNYDKILEIFQKEKPEIVFHLAAQPLVLEGYNNPGYTYQTNIMGTVNVLDAIRNTESVRSAVFITTDKVYKIKKGVTAYKEMDELGGFGPYSTSKAADELIIQSYTNTFFELERYKKEHDVLVASARSGNIIGGGDWGEYRLMTDIVRAIFEHKTLNIRNKEGIRPWIYILETLEGYLHLSKRLYEKDKKTVGPWNFSPNLKDQITVSEVVDIALKIASDKNININFRSQNQFQETKTLKLDSSKARRELDWKTRYNAKERIIKTFEWYKIYYNNPKEIIKYTEDCINEFWR